VCEQGEIQHEYILCECVCLSKRSSGSQGFAGRDWTSDMRELLMFFTRDATAQDCQFIQTDTDALREAYAGHTYSRWLL